MLATVLDGLGTIVQVLAAPSGLDVPVGRALIHDPVAPPPIERDDLILAVGTAANGPAAVEIIAAAGAAGASAVALKVDDAPTPALLDAAKSTGVALLGIAPTLAWGQLHTLLRTATAAAGAARADETDPQGGAVGDLFSLANAIAAMVGGPTTIEDRESTVLAYSAHDGPVDEHRRQTILGHRVPEAWRRRLQQDGVFRRLWTEPGPVRINYPDADPPLRPRLAIAVRAGDENLGSIWVAEGDRPLGPDAERALVEAARIAALHLIRSRSSDDLDRQRRSSLLRAVLDGTTTPDVLADSLDVQADAHVTVLAFRLWVTEPEDVAFATRRAGDLVGLYCESFRRKAAHLAIGPVIYVLIPDSVEPDRSRLVALASDIIDRIRGPLHTDVSAAIGATFRGLANVTAARRQADQVLSVVDRRTRVATIEELRSQTILAALRDYARRDPDVLEGKLGVLREHDRDRNTSYVETLKAYLDAFGEVPAAAAGINVHQNTFRYRLRRLAEIAELDLSDPVERLVIHLQLHLEP